ncbi:uncharacterized protein DS421_5g136800 [Arachis hypogaea]|nr:uncharacterized protein DS421_5g136800 [Arachis hypogaea]
MGPWFHLPSKQSLWLVWSISYYYEAASVLCIEIQMPIWFMKGRNYLMWQMK